MKLSYLMLPLFVAVAIVVSQKADHRVAPETKNPFWSRTLPTVVSPATVFGTTDRGGNRYLVGESGVIAVPRDTEPFVLFSFVKPAPGVDLGLANGPFSFGLADDPENPTLGLVVALDEPEKPPAPEVDSHGQASQP